MLAKGMKAAEHDSYFGPKAIRIIDEMFQMVASKLASSGQPFLGGQKPGADDVVFAALSSWLLFEYTLGGGHFPMGRA